VRLLACRKREPSDPSRTSRGGDETNRHANQFNGSTEKRGSIDFFASGFLSRAVSSNRSNRILTALEHISSIRESKRAICADFRAKNELRAIEAASSRRFFARNSRQEMRPEEKGSSGTNQRELNARSRRVDHVEKPRKRIPDDYKQMRNRDETKCRIASNSLIYYILYIIYYILYIMRACARVNLQQKSKLARAEASSGSPFSTVSRL